MLLKRKQRVVSLLWLVAQNHRKKLFIADLYHARHVLVLLPERVCDGLKKNASLNEVVERQTPFCLRVITRDNQLCKLWRQSVTQLRKCCITYTQHNQLFL